MATRQQQRQKARKAAAAGNRSGPPILWVGLIVVVVLAGIVAVASSGGSGDDVEPIDFPSATVDGEQLPSFGEGVDLAVGRPAPTVSGSDFTAHTVQIAADGRPKVLLFLAHWCPHCQAEVPVVQDWLDSGGGSSAVDVVAVATSIDPDRPNYPPNEWLVREEWTSPVVVDGDGRVAAAFGLTQFPYWVFVDADGNVAGREVGELDPATLQQRVDALAATAT